MTRIYSPEDGQKMGLAGMIGEMVMRCDRDLSPFAPMALAAIEGQGEMNWRALAQLITVLENGNADAAIGLRPARAGQDEEGPGAGHHRHRVARASHR